MSSYAHTYEDFVHTHPQEKVSLHLDNRAYLLGDTIWYKAYVADAQRMRPTDISRVLYVDLLTQEGIFVTRNRHQISEDGTCDGWFSLSDTTYNAGFYEVRAYTAWMTYFIDPNDTLNFKDICDVAKRVKTLRPLFKQDIVPGIFSRVIPVFYNEELTMPQRIAVGTHEEKSYPRQVAVSFFPESGHRIQNTRTRIAFEITDENGQSINPVCQLMRNGHPLGPVKSTLFKGRGVLELNPHNNVATDSLSLCFRWKDKQYAFPLPSADSVGVTMICEQKNDTLHVHLQNTTGNTALNAMLLSRGRIIGQQKVFSISDTTLLFPLALCPSGVAEICLVDDNERMKARRLFFNFGKDLEHISCTIDMQDSLLMPFQRIKGNLHLKEIDGSPLQDADLSLSIRDCYYDTMLYSVGNVLTDMLLASDIRGYVDSPTYYFEKNDDLHRQHLDLLMMVQGWYRYDWASCNDSVFKRHYNPDIKLQLAGESPLPLEGAFFVQYNLDSARFKVHHLRCRVYDSAQVVYDSTVAVHHRDAFSFPIPELYGNYDIRFDVIPPAVPKALEHEIPGLGIRFSIYKNNFIWPRPRQLSYYETTLVRQTHLCEDFHSPQVLRPIVRYKFFDFSLFPESTVPEESDGNAYIYFFGMAGIPTVIDSRIWKVTENGGPRRVPNLSEHQRFYTRRYKYVDFYADLTDRRRFLHPLDRSFGAKGCMNFIVNDEYDFPDSLITTQKHPFYPWLPQYFEAVYYGFQPKVQYYSPDYSKLPLPSSDRRRTLYWNPNIHPDAMGKVPFECYNNSTAKEVIVELNGWTKEGTPITGTFSIGKDCVSK